MGAVCVCATTPFPLVRACHPAVRFCNFANPLCHCGFASRRVRTGLTQLPQLALIFTIFRPTMQRKSLRDGPTHLEPAM